MDNELLRDVILHELDHQRNYAETELIFDDGSIFVQYDCTDTIGVGMTRDEVNEEVARLDYIQEQLK